MLHKYSVIILCKSPIDKACQIVYNNYEEQVKLQFFDELCDGSDTTVK